MSVEIMRLTLTRNFLKLSKFNIFLYKHIHNTVPLNAGPKRTVGAFLLKRARKYQRPSLKEDVSYEGVGPHVKVESVTNSLKARGFCKERKSYTPPADVEKHIHEICAKAQDQQLPHNWVNLPLSNSNLKFKVLTQCIDAFNHDIPNSMLCKLKHVGDVIDYFNTPVDGMTPYETLIRDGDKLPENLHIIQDPIIFNPDTDTFFGGQTAFPGRKRIIFTKRGEEFEKTIEWPNV